MSIIEGFSRFTEFLKLAASVATFQRPTESQKEGVLRGGPYIGSNKSRSWLSNVYDLAWLYLKSLRGMLVGTAVIATTLVVVLRCESIADPGLVSTKTSTSPDPRRKNGAEVRKGVGSCAAIAARAPEFTRCGIYAYLDTAGSCVVPPEPFGLSTDIDVATRGYCAALEIKFETKLQEAKAHQSAEKSG